MGVARVLLLSLSCGSSSLDMMSLMALLALLTSSSSLSASGLCTDSYSVLPLLRFLLRELLLALGGRPEEEGVDVSWLGASLHGEFSLQFIMSLIRSTVGRWL